MSTKRCWAQILGGCSGGLSDEHPAGHHGDLLTDVTILGFHADLENEVVPIDALKQKVLCQDHNEQLGREVDPEGGRAYRAIVRWFDGKDGEQVAHGELWIPTVAEISGQLFGRWLCKYSCNMQAIRGAVPDVQYVRCAFGLEAACYYLRDPMGGPMQYRRRIRYENHLLQYPDETAHRIVFRVLFMGLEFLVTPQPLEDIREFLVDQHRAAFDAEWKRPREVTSFGEPGVPTAYLRFSWGEEPA